ncbi:MAG: transposase domain-containing protein [Ruminococcus sp.]
MWCRKSFLFGNKKSGAQGGAVVCNIIETAKDNNLDPYKYVTYIFTRFPNLM